MKQMFPEGWNFVRTFCVGAVLTLAFSVTSCALQPASIGAVLSMLPKPPAAAP